MNKRKLYVKWYSDPGHGWLRVRREDLNRLPGVAETISSFSYRKNNWVYLEEDSDAGKFLREAEALGYTVVQRNNPPADIRSPIRFYDSYRSVTMELVEVKTSELTERPLDWAAAKCEGWEDRDFPKGILCRRNKRGVMEYEQPRKYSSSWTEGGPIIEREEITLDLGSPEKWVAMKFEGEDERECESGPTPLIAAMRCYVASKLGDTVKVPKELLS